MISLMKFLFKFSPGIVFTALLTGVLSGISSAALIAVINSAINKGDDGRFTVFLAFAGLAGTMLIAGIVSKISLILLAQSAVFELRMSLSRQIIDAPLKFLETYGAPRILASLIDDVQVLSGTLLGIPALCINLATVIICLIYIGWLSLWVLGAVFLFTIIGVATYYTLLQQAWNYLSKAREMQNSLFGDFRALTTGTKELKLHNERRSAFFSDELQTNALSYRKFSTKGSQIYAGADSWGQFLFILLIGLILFILPQFTFVNSEILMGYILALLYIMAPLEVLINFFPSINRAQISLEQINSLGLTLSEEKIEKNQTFKGLKDSFKKVELKNAIFEYQKAVDEKPFKVGPTNLEINAGEVVFVIGGNGSGKTTLMKLITGLYLPVEGEVKLNGEKLVEDNLDWYRANFSAVFSDFFLFDKLLGLNTPLMDKVANEYLKKLHLEEKVTIKNGELSTTDLSQGQRKRLALLTSFLENKNFYVFDEWAADQDPIFKQIFYKELLPELKARGKTLLVITHDDRFYSLADRVIKLDYGKVTEISPTEYPPIEGNVTIKQISENIEITKQTYLREQDSKVFRIEKDRGFKYLIGGRYLEKLFGRNKLQENPISLPKKLSQAILSLFLMGFAGYFAISSLAPPEPLSANIPAADFSSERAIEHIKNITKKPHPIGTEENEKVRDYIIQSVSDLGVDAEVLTSSTIESFGSELKGGTTKNILVKIPGTVGKQTIAFVSHYDSTPNSFGASDNGAAVGAMLETIRAIKAGEQAKNNLHFLFTDGEEITMLGARSIRDSSDYLKEIDLAFNFEARGSSGSSIMFETSKGNEWLIENLKQAVPGVVATSVSYDIYRYMPNITDFTILKENDIEGLNFAFIENGEDYHSKLDSFENLSKASLQNHGQNAISLAKHFGNVETIQNETNNAIYFNLPGRFLINYSSFWLLPKVLVSLILLLVIGYFGVKRNKLSSSGVILGLIGTVLVIAASTIASLVLSLIFHYIYTNFGGNSQVFTDTGIYQIFGGLLLTIGIAGVYYRWFCEKINWFNLFYGNLLVWWVLLLLSLIFLPGGSYLFFWSLLGGLLAAFVVILVEQDSSYNWIEFAGSWLFVLPTIILFVPLIYLIGAAFGINSVVIITALAAITMSSMLPQLRLLSGFGKWQFPVVILVSTFILFGLSAIPFGYDVENPKPQHLFYAINSDNQKAVWASADEEVNDWSEQLLTATPEKGKIIDYFPSNYADYAYSPAPQKELSSPELEVLSDVVEDEKRTLKVRINSSRKAAIIYLFADNKSPIISYQISKEKINLKDLPVNNNLSIRKLLTYHGNPDKDLIVDFELEKNKPFTLTVLDQTYGLPLNEEQNTIPGDLMFSDIIYNNSTLVSKSFEFQRTSQN